MKTFAAFAATALAVAAVAGLGIALQPAPALAGDCSTAKPAPKVQKDIVDTAVAAGSFKTLATALTAADLIETLKGPGPFTVFAPTDEAFAKVDAAALQNLLKPENKADLAGVLTYHVVPGRVMAADVKPGKVKTVNGAELEITVVDGKVMLNGKATVVKTDVTASNGVIHVIDTVVMPAKEGL